MELIVIEELHQVRGVRVDIGEFGRQKEIHTINIQIKIDTSRVDTFLGCKARMWRVPPTYIINRCYERLLKKVQT